MMALEARIIAESNGRDEFTVVTEVAGKEPACLEQLMESQLAPEVTGIRVE